MTVPRRTPMTDAEVSGIIDKAIEHAIPRIKALIIELLDERQELIGHPNTTVEERAANKADALFVRAWRTRYDEIAKAVGRWVLRAFFVGFVIVLGIGGKSLGWGKWPP